MVKLLDCQEELADGERVGEEELRLFAIALLCSLLDIFESDLTTDEATEISQFCLDWGRR